MKAKERTVEKAESEIRTSRNHAAQFIAVRDSRNRKVRGLWQRSGRFYLQFRIPGERSARRVPLQKKGHPVANLSEAMEARADMLHSRRHGDALPLRGRKPAFSVAISEYIGHHRRLAEQDDARRKSSLAIGKDSILDAPKKLSTVRKEELILGRWLSYAGDIQVDRISKSHVTAYLETVLESGRTRRTRNIHLSVFRNLLRHFADKGLLTERSLPTAGVKLLRHRTPKREFLRSDDVQRLVARSAEAGTNGQQLSDLIKLLAYSGAREMEALRLRWQDVDFAGAKLHIGRDGQAKNRETRELDFNPDLEGHLCDMFSRRAPDSEWIFPSSRRGVREDHDHWQNPHKVWYECRMLANLPHAHLHDLRHHFASRCVMAGIDYMTIARWLGHLDGGILVGKTYGHLADEHKKAMAARLVFSPRIVPHAAAAAS